MYFSHGKVPSKALQYNHASQIFQAEQTETGIHNMNTYLE